MCCLLLVACCVRFVVRCLVLVVRRFFVVGDLLVAGRCLSLVVGCWRLWFGVFCSLVVVC